MPQGGVVAGGSATLSTPASNTLQINQSSSKAIINWQSFNVGSQEQVRFQQPNSSSITLNRINPQNGASKIFGTITANGQVWLVNGAGLWFGPSSHIDVGGFMATTADIHDKDFLNGNYHFTQSPNWNGSINNQGTIVIRNAGLGAFIGTNVENSGHIVANMGTVVLGVSKEFTVDFSGDQLINFAVGDAVTQQARDAQGNLVRSRVSNSGSIIANGGKILMTAHTAGNVLDGAINMSGIAQAKSVSMKNGVIILSSNANIHVSGKLIASGKRHKQQGGKISVLADNIVVEKTAVIDASGNTAGGEVLIGGNARGAGPEKNASTTYIANGAEIKADALVNGNGGKIVVWADKASYVYGSLSAQGGALGGNGGYIETSGHYLDVSGIHINTSASKGVAGTWLLDPSDLTISLAADTNVSSTSPFQPSNQLSNSNLAISTLLAALNSGNVIIETNAGSGPGNGDIFVTTPITWSNANSLTLSAYRNINASASITNTGGASVILRADNTGTGTGTVVFSGGNNVTLSGGSGSVSVYYNPAVFGTQTQAYTGGTTPTQYMLVNTALNLQNINNFLNQNFALGKDITLAGNFTPLGTTALPYTGQFDGQNFTIHNLSITNTTPDVNLGLFGVISNNRIANLHLDQVSISQTADANGTSVYIGSLVGLNNGGILENDSVINPTITLTGTNFGIVGSRGYYDVGGLVGATFGGQINNSYSQGGTIISHVITNPNASNAIAFHEVGGFIGGVHGGAALSNDYSTTNIITNGNVTVSGAGATGELIVGGFGGRLDQASTATNIYSTGAVNVTTTYSVPTATATGYVMAAGLFGATSIANSGNPTPPPVIDNAYSTSAVTLHATLTNSAPGTATILAGGLMGQSNGILTNSHSSGAVIVTLTSDLTSSNEFVYIGGLAGDNFTTIQNSYSTSPVTLTGNNYGNQITVGGFVGGNIILFDKLITESYSSGLMNIAVNNYAGGQLYIGGYAGLNIYYGNPPPARLPLANDYSTSILNVSGVNDASTTIIGGFVGANGIDGNDPGGDITNSYNTGFINNNVTTINGGNTTAGGFMGQTVDSSDPLSPPLVFTSNFYDTGTTGFNQNQAVGNMPGAFAGVTPGCFGGGACPNGGSADLSSQVTYNTAGWNFSTTWGIINNASYPYLLSSNPLPPQVISGTTPAPGGTVVNLVSNGQIIATTLTGPNGFYYFFEPNGTIATNELGLVYLSGSSIKGNTIFSPALDGNSSGSSIEANSIQVGSNSTLTIANNDLVNLINGLLDADLLYSGSGSTVTLGTNANPLIHFFTTPTTTYVLNGALTSIAGGTVDTVFNGPVTLTSNASVEANAIHFANTVSGSNHALTTNSSGETKFDGNVSLSSLSVSANAIAINTNAITTSNDQLYNGLVNLDVNTTLTAKNIEFTNGITGAHNLMLLGQAGDNFFTLKGPLSVSNIAVTGSLSGNNSLRVNTNNYETWEITATNTGNVTGLVGLTGTFNFANIGNLRGGTLGNNFIFSDGALITGTLSGTNINPSNALSYANYLSALQVMLTNNNYQGVTNNASSTTISDFNHIYTVTGNDISSLTLLNKSNTLVFTSYNSGYVNDPLNFLRFSNFISQSGQDVVNFIAPAVYNLTTKQLTVNGAIVHLTNFNPNNFTGNIRFVDESAGIDIPNNNFLPSSSDVSSIITGGIPVDKNPNANAFTEIVNDGYYQTIQQYEAVSSCGSASGYIYIDNHAIPVEASCSASSR